MEAAAALTDMYDQALLGILQHVGNVEEFLRVLFGFLYRKTDFYRLLLRPGDRLGFPPGAAQAMALQVPLGGSGAAGPAALCRWQVRPWRLSCGRPRCCRSVLPVFVRSVSPGLAGVWQRDGPFVQPGENRGEREREPVTGPARGCHPETWGQTGAGAPGTPQRGTAAGGLVWGQFGHG